MALLNPNEELAGYSFTNTQANLTAWFWNYLFFFFFFNLEDLSIYVSLERDFFSLKLVAIQPRY